MVVPRCRWCSSPFLRIDSHYWCSSKRCRIRQASYAIAAHGGGKINYLYLPLPVQAEIEEAASVVIRGGRSHKILWGGAAGPGKSFGGRNVLYRRCLNIPNYHALILRESFPQLERSHMVHMAMEEARFKAAGVPCEFVPTKFVFKFGNGSRIELGHMDNEKAVKNYLSAEYDGVLADEGVLYKPNALLGLISRARTSNLDVRAAGGPLFLIATNPGGPSERLLRSLCMDKEPDLDTYPQLRTHYHADEFAYIAANLEDNPYLDPEYEADLALNQPWRYQQLRYNNWDVVAGQFFDTFRPNPTDLSADPVDWTHVADLGDAESCEWFRSMDWGYTNPGCVLWWACLPDSTYYVRREWKFTHCTIEEVAEGVLERTADWGIPESSVRYTTADPALWGVGGEAAALRGERGERMSETFTNSGLSLVPADNDRRSGWQRVREFFRNQKTGRPGIIIHPDCKYLIRTISEAISAKHDPEDVDTNIDDHAIDTLRYGAMSRPAPTRIHRTHSARSFLGRQRQVLEFKRRMAVR